MRFHLVITISAALTACTITACAPKCDTTGTSTSQNSDNHDTEPTECGGMCTGPARCPDGYYYTGRPNCNCVPKPSELHGVIGVPCSQGCADTCNGDYPAEECFACLSACESSP